MADDILLKDLIDSELVFVNSTASSLEEVINNVASKMIDKDIVKDSYPEAVISREKELPTGLNIGSEFGIAIPHTDVQHVNRSAIGITTLEKPIKVHSMVNPEDIIDTQLVFNLSVADPDGQIKILQQLMGLFKKVNCNIKCIFILKNPSVMPNN
ncbi:PTS sugar transporter subunit IIA [Aerococcus sp. JJEM-2022a]|uniref:PTS sugar transporter subunit IIA n=1 Tax=Aerococcus loyolae TaxID=2976809 RepID=UPI002277B214|nr:PTS sugar transporter subunit IIA [Aerococcus loyolae]MCY3028650.1 PTS sugar transporter subunit IIA [Aerococcus loyolae]